MVTTVAEENDGNGGAGRTGAVHRCVVQIKVQIVELRVHLSAIMIGQQYHYHHYNQSRLCLELLEEIEETGAVGEEDAGDGVKRSQVLPIAHHRTEGRS